MQSHGADTIDAEQAVVPFSYAPVPALQGAADILSFPEIETSANSSIHGNSPSAQTDALQPAFDHRLAEETQRSFAAGRARGIEEGQAAEHAALAETNAAEAVHRARELSRLALEFASERDAYLERIETEVVRLALAIAARILRREAQTDPLLLLGAVRVALGQLAGTTRVRLRVPASHATLWSEAIDLLPARSLKPEIVAVQDIRLGDCLLEAELGSVDLGVPAQLAEIERRLFANTPQAARAPTDTADSALDKQAPLDKPTLVAQS